MRVTHKSITYKAIVNMQRSLRQVEGKTNEISTGRQISLPVSYTHLTLPTKA